MKLLIISDIHGSCERLQEVLKTPYHFDAVLLVGDAMYHGPRNPILDDYNPQGVADLLNSITVPIIAVRGNCDSEVDQMLCHFKMMQDYTLTEINGRRIFCTHGHLIDPWTEGVKTGADIFISGHTHVPVLNLQDATLLYNPGSIALPKEGHPATYGYMDETSLTTYTLDHLPYMSHTF